LADVRKQYHFRASPDGLLAWDVDRLITLTRDLQPLSIPLTEIEELREPYWHGDGVPPTVEDVAMHCRLIQEADLSYPIILCPRRRVMDGMHRVAKAFLLGQTHILAIVLPTDPAPDYVGRAPEDLPY
jgi:hypothetical protein